MPVAVVRYEDGNGNCVLYSHRVSKVVRIDNMRHGGGLLTLFIRPGTRRTAIVSVSPPLRCDKPLPTHGDINLYIDL